MLACALVLTLAAQDVDALLARLGDADIEKRAEAELDLLKVGKPALDALRRAAKSPDQEIAARAARLVDEIDWPEPGPASNGLTLAIKAKTQYAANEPVVVRARITNISDREIVLDQLDFSNESDILQLTYGGDRRPLHLCGGRREPGPDLPSRVRISAGGRLVFTFSPRAWCALAGHSKCYALPVEAGSHRLSAALSIQRAPEGAWSGSAASGEVRFAVTR